MNNQKELLNNTTEQEEKMGQVLISFAGNSDPTRGNHDGPLLHICRHYQPSKIYLLLTEEMGLRDKENNIYVEAIRENLNHQSKMGYQPQVTKKYLDIKEAHRFDLFFEVIQQVFEEAKQENPEAEILVNMSSGTTQMLSSLLNYIVNSQGAKITPIQVSTFADGSNKSEPVKNDYQVLIEAENNQDNQKPTNRIEKPDLTRYARVRILNQVEKLLEQLDYEAARILMNQQIFKENKKIDGLLRYGAQRKRSGRTNANNILDQIGPEFKHLKYYRKMKGQKEENWCQVVDYYALAKSKSSKEANDINGYVIMIEPLTVKMYLMILEDLLGVQPKMIFREVKKDDFISYKIDLQKINSNLEEEIKKELKVLELRDNFVSDKVLRIAILHYIEDKSNQKPLSNVLTKEDFLKLSKGLESVKEMRNEIAHNLKTVDRKDFEKATNYTTEELNNIIEDFFEKYYSNNGYQQKLVDVYPRLNQVILELIKKEV